ncbi:MAG TPA: hypothetical protein HPQ03_03385 [Deltaproteobacteria bacterium]|nr:hypothetical protein [Deltaproteobacteria bacterium]
MTDPYLSGLVPKNPFHKKLPVSGSLVAVLNLKYDRRGMKLMPQRSRAFLKNEIHELLLTDETAASGDTVERIFCLGFFEVASGGIIIKGDTLKIRDRVIGTVAGFNSDHMPNHLNIVIYSAAADTGKKLGIELKEAVVIEKI